LSTLAIDISPPRCSRTFGRNRLEAPDEISAIAVRLKADHIEFQQSTQ
jgi:hypothetical protein